MYYIFRKTELISTEFNKVACYVTGSPIFLEIHRGKGGMKSSRYHLKLGAKATCTNRLMEEMKGLGQMALKGSTRDCFLFDSWSLSKKAENEATSIGVDLVGMVKTNTKGFCKATIEGLAKDWPGGYYIVFSINPVVTGERLLVAIG